MTIKYILPLHVAKYGVHCSCIEITIVRKCLDLFDSCTSKGIDITAVHTACSAPLIRPTGKQRTRISGLSVVNSRQVTSLLHVCDLLLTVAYPPGRMDQQRLLSLPKDTEKVE